MKTLRLLLLVLVPAAAPAQGLRGAYFAGRGTCPSLPADIKVARLDPGIDFFANGSMGSNFNTADAGVPIENFTARWSGTYEAFTAGTHRFEVEHNDEVMLTIDGTVVLSRTGARATSTVPVDMVLTAGEHIFELCYVHTTGPSRIRVRQMTPGTTAYVAIPPSQLFFDPPFRPDAGVLAFDTIPVGTYLLNQLETSHGIRFSQVLGPSGFYYSRPRVVAAGAGVTTATPPNVLRNESWDALEAQEISAGTPLRFSFVRAQSHVALAAGTQSQVFPQNPPAILRAYDTLGRIVAADRLAPVNTSIISRLHVVRGGTDITTVTLDFGDVLRDERIDGLRYEAWTLAPIINDTTAPVVEFVEPTDGAMVEGAGGFSIIVRVREMQSGIGPVELTAGGATYLMGLDGTPEAGCSPPTCARYRTGITLSNGTHTLTARAADGAGNRGTASVSVGFTGVTEVMVVDELLRPVEGAELYINGVLHPRLIPASGLLSFYPPMAVGTQLVARQRTHEHNTYRGNHAQGSTDNWSFRVYRTSVRIADDGTPGVHRVARPGSRQLLALRNDNALIGAHITASANWHAGVQSDRLRERFTVMSDFLYNATDGQYFIERVDLYDVGRDWGNVDMRIFASNSMRPFVNEPVGGFLGWNLFGTAYMHLNLYDSGYTFAHEFGHYGLDLRDEYADGDPGVRCTTHGNDPAEPTFGAARARTSCMMWNQGAAAKLCSHHGSNPHVRGTRQGDQSCWDHVVQRYGGLGGVTLKTPTTRGAIPGNAGVDGPVVETLVSMVPVVAAWRPQIHAELRSGELCADFVSRFTNADGTPAAMVPVYLHLLTGGAIRQGLTDAAGEIRIVGAHRGDTLVTNGRAEAGGDFATDVGRMSVVSASIRVPARACPARAADVPRPTPVVARP